MSSNWIQDTGNATKNGPSTGALPKTEDPIQTRKTAELLVAPKAEGARLGGEWPPGHIIASWAIAAGLWYL